MKRMLRGFAMGLLIGGLVGLWFGMNIGKDQPLLSNPFTEISLSDRVNRAAEQMTDKAGEAAEKAGDAVEQGADSVEDELQ